jgi:hypothetical protein
MILWTITTSLAAIGIALHILFFYRLKRDCHSEWVRLGSPNPFLPNDVESSRIITKYILRGYFERLPNKGLVRLGRVLRYYEWFFIIAFLGFALLFLYSLIARP